VKPIKRRRLIVIVGIVGLLYVAAMVFVFSRVDIPDLTILALLVVVVAVVAQIGAKWFFGLLFRQGVEENGGTLKPVSAFRGALVGAGVARLIPAGGAITPVAMAWSVRREAPGAAGAAVRATGLNYAGLLLGTGFCLLWIRQRGLYQSLFPATVLIASATLIIGALVMFGSGWLGSLTARLPDRIKDLLGPTAVNHPPNWRAQILLWVRLFLEAAAMALVMEAFGIHLTPTQVFAAFGIGQLFAGLPGTPGGAGFAELGLVGALAAFGFPASETVAPVLIFRVVSYWIPAAAGLVAGGAEFLRTETEA
jgi:uncharacterized membrane protein YbhN (UPF0104 family)